MSTIALIIVLLGLSIMVSRAPLIVAPESTRTAYLQLFNTDAKMRVMGMIMGAVSLLILWAALGVLGLAPTILRVVAGIVLTLSAAVMIPFPAFAKRLATNVWNAFPPPLLRVMGAFAVIVGALIVWYGLSL